MLEKGAEIISEDNIYGVICIPTKIVSGGVDKSSTNISEGTKICYTLVLVDHGTEGQVLNVNNGETSYYFKIED